MGFSKLKHLARITSPRRRCYLLAPASPFLQYSSFPSSAFLSKPAPCWSQYHSQGSSLSFSSKSALLQEDLDPYNKVEARMGRGSEMPAKMDEACHSLQEAPAGLMQSLVATDDARRLLRLMDVEAFKRSLAREGCSSMHYQDMLRHCQDDGVAASNQEAAKLIASLDEAGVVFLFRDTVYLHPQQIKERVVNVLPMPLRPLEEEEDPEMDELRKLEKVKEEIDKKAYKHARVVLWMGLGVHMALAAALVHLTYWEFSWDVMEPIVFFMTSAGIITGYLYFLVTFRDPSYRDLLQRLLQSRQRKLMKLRNFDGEKWEQLQHCPKACSRRKVPEDENSMSVETHF